MFEKSAVCFLICHMKDFENNTRKKFVSNISSPFCISSLMIGSDIFLKRKGFQKYTYWSFT